MCSFFFFNDTATTEIYTLSLHDALPILAENVGLGRNPLGCLGRSHHAWHRIGLRIGGGRRRHRRQRQRRRSEEHTSELQSRQYLVCRILLEKKNALHYKLLRHEVHVEFR